MECKLSEIFNLQTKDGFPSLTSNLFVFISCFASEFLMTEGLSPDDSKLYNSLRAYFTAQDYPTDVYFQILSEYEPLASLLAVFPKNKKDFNKWNECKELILRSGDVYNEIVAGDKTLKTNKIFLDIVDKDGKKYVCKPRFVNNELDSFVSIGNSNIVQGTSIKFSFEKEEITLKELDSMKSDDFFNSCEDLIKLSNEQREAVEFDKNKNVVILAGAGSGKTRTLSSRYLYLHFVKKVPLEKLLLVTFTRRAKADMQEKTIKLFKKIINNPNAKTGAIKAKTIDSFFRYLLSTFYSNVGFTKKPSFKVDVKNRQIYKKIVTELIIKNRMEYSFFKKGPVDVDSFFLRELDNHMRGSRSLDSNYDSLAKITVDWQLEHNEIYTFAAASAILINALNSNPELVRKVNGMFDYVLIDEFQDINDIQDSVFKKMYESPNVHFTFVGDDDQSIYFWRGSNNEIIKNISKRDDTDQIYLRTNYRNNPYIVKAGNAILNKIETRAKNGKEIIPYQTTGSKIRIFNLKNDYSKLALEVKSLIETGIKPGKIAILSRMGTSTPSDPTRKPLDYVIDAFTSANIKFDVRTPEADFNSIYDLFKYLLLGLSNSEKTYSFASQIIEDMRQEEITNSGDNENITPALLNDIVFHDGAIDNKLFSKKFVDYLNSVQEVKISIDNAIDCDVEELVSRYTLSASFKFMHSLQNRVIDFPIFRKLSSYSINNPFKWPTEPDKIYDFFDAFEESLDLSNDTNDINTENLDTVKISTIHNFKGLEFDTVFVIGLNNGEFPNIDKLLRERQRKEQELKVLVDTSTQLQNDIEPSIKEKYSQVTYKRNFKCSSDKFIDSYHNFVEYLSEEANLSQHLTSDKLENYGQAYDDFLNIFINKLKEVISQKTNDIDKLQYDFDRFIEKKSLKLTPEEVDKIKSIKLEELNEQKRPILQKLAFLEKTMKDIEFDSQNSKELFDLSLVLKGCIENKSKISELENYVKELDYELEKKKEEERKLFYVAITRPSDILYLVYSSQFDGRQYQSEFITEIPDELTMTYNVESLEERRKANDSIKKIEKIYDVSNGEEIDDEEQIIESNKLFSNSLFNEYLKNKESSFFDEHPVFNILTNSSRDYFVNALYHFFLQDYIGVDFTTEYLFNIQRAAEEFMCSMTGENAAFPTIESKDDIKNVVSSICNVTKNCITNPPTHEDTRKFLVLNFDDWKTKLKKCGIIHYFVRSGKFSNLTKKYVETYQFQEMKNDPDLFLKSIIDISNYRNAFAHNHKPVWNGDPKEDALNFFENIILNFYTLDEINNQIKIIDVNGKSHPSSKIQVGCKVYSKEFGIGTIDGIRVESPSNKYLIEFEKGNHVLLLEYEFSVISYPSDSKTTEKNPKQIFKSSIGKIFSIETDMPNNIISQGTGFIIKDNLVLTNAHVISKIDSGEVYISNKVTGSFYGQTAKMFLNVMFYDIGLDLCVLSLNKGQHFPGLFLSSLPIEIGDKIYCIGNTRGEGLCLLDGIISDTNRKIADNPYFMFNANISNGNSGGPVLNTRGEVVGIASAGDKVVQSMNYAIPNKTIKMFLKNHNVIV